MSIGVWSQGINVSPTVERPERMTVSGVEVEVGRSGDSIVARFMSRDATVVIRGFASELGLEEVKSLVALWIEEARVATSPHLRLALALHRDQLDTRGAFREPVTGTVLAFAPSGRRPTRRIARHRSHEVPAG
jgi:hypothetical protein